MVGEAGGFANTRFLDVYEPWRKTVRLVLPLALLPMVGVLGVGALLWPAWLEFYAGAAVGTALTMYAWAIDSPPEWIDKWRRGRDGERQTARALRGLSHQDWMVAHDLAEPGRRGNVDHVVVGPGGIYVLETKNLSGTLSVDDQSLVISHDHSDLDRFVNRSLAGQVRGRAAALQNELVRISPALRWVNAVVVLWGEFPARVAKGHKIVFVHGDELAGWLAEQPETLSVDAREAAYAHLQTRIV